MDKHTAREYIQANFRDDDRLAVVLIQKTSETTEQRVAPANRIVTDEFQAWLRYRNKEKYEIYVSMNALHEGARGRKKTDVAEIRHVYLDFDKNGTEAIQALKNRGDFPTPNHIIESSAGKFQTVWRVEQFEKDQAETLMRGMVRELGADPAATDSSRVLRVPGFYNHKYGTPHFVTVENLSNETYTPSHFPDFPVEGLSSRLELGRPVGARTDRDSPNGRSQSERDWAYAMRAIARGDEPDQVARSIAAYRPDKPNPQYYAEHTVEKALAALNRSNEVRLETGDSSVER
ncbi:MAG: hypothetical protein JWO80_5021 [Bryobacterales bacterium]|nr:hypothetical protein [Bryobacterales bacterium]